jgi:hypothetical protein
LSVHRRFRGAFFSAEAETSEVAAAGAEQPTLVSVWTARGRGHAHAHEVEEDSLFFKHNLFRTLERNSFRTPAKLQTRIESEFWAHVLGKIRAHVKSH